MGAPLDMSQIVTNALADCHTPDQVEEWAKYLHRLGNCVATHAKRLRADSKVGGAPMPPAPLFGDGPKPPSAKQLSVLIVEDNANVLASLAEMLRSDGCYVLETNSSSDAVTRLEGWRPDVVLIDLSLPRMNGVVLAEYIRQLKKPKPLLIATTSLGDEELTATAFAAKFDHHLLKDEDPRRLCDLLRDHAKQIGRAYGP
jgi:CheY-like chemotaxis protein